MGQGGKAEFVETKLTLGRVSVSMVPPWKKASDTG